MVIEQIWEEFKIKLKNDSFTPDDFNEELRSISCELKVFAKKMSRK
ncbi:MAG: hypothetical protein FWD71_12420 [Oscillospiraceae bacterium]|nr:hypothetical protein [Oscillospiraceae bacterium]